MKAKGSVTAGASLGSPSPCFLSPSLPLRQGSVDDPVKRLELKACDAEFWHHFHKACLFSFSQRAPLPFHNTIFYPSK